MSDQGLGVPAFEELRETNAHGADYWSARALQPLLGYSQWRRFEQAIKRAIVSCEQSGNDPEHHFAGAGKVIVAGKGALQNVPDYHLSRFACYLIAQNGDPRKPEIAAAQGYFAIQTRRQEESDQLEADRERLELRKQTGEEFKLLSGAARAAGVENRMFGVFHDAGYRGLYGGLNKARIKARKGIPDKDELLDRMNATELAANQFRMTQARDKLAREGIRDQQLAIRTHEEVGQEVRAAIERIGGEMPETIPPAEHIREVEKRLHHAPRIDLSPQDTRGLLGTAAQVGVPSTAAMVVTIHETDDEAADQDLLQSVVSVLRNRVGADSVELVVHDAAGMEHRFGLPSAKADAELDEELQGILLDRGTVWLRGR